MIYHITTKKHWDDQSENSLFTVDTLQSLGFIHCALKDQILRVANSRLKGKTDIILLCINEDLLTSKLIFEDLSSLGEEHPHIYGEINMNSIMEVVELKPGDDGMFVIPEELIF